MSRRDWFRLRKRPAPSEARLGAEETSGLQSIEEPVNHGGVDLASLPPMHEAVLDANDVTALFTDLERYATSVQLIARRTSGSGGDHSPQLRPALERLLAGDIRKLQVRYQWQNAHWIDTLEQQAGGYRLVRIRHEQLSR